MLWGDHVFRIRKIKELLHGIISYIRSHLWVSIMGSLMLLFLLVVLIFQEYLKNEYYDYLLDETWKTESAVLSVASNSLNSMLEESLYACGEMATDKNLYNYVNRLTEADKTTYMRQRSVLFSHLQSIAFHSTEVSCVTIVNQDGVLIEGARYWSGDIKSSFGSMKNQVAAGLNMGIAGIPWWTTDIGGFFGANINDPAFHELLIRWFQYGCFCPVMRMHGYRWPLQPQHGTTGGAACVSGAVPV